VQRYGQFFKIQKKVQEFIEDIIVYIIIRQIKRLVENRMPCKFIFILKHLTVCDQSKNPVFGK